MIRSNGLKVELKTDEVEKLFVEYADSYQSSVWVKDRIAFYKLG